MGDNSVAVVDYLIARGLAPPGVCTHAEAAGELEAHLAERHGEARPVVWALHDATNQDGRGCADDHVALLWRKEGSGRTRIRFAFFIQKGDAARQLDVEADPDRWAEQGVFQVAVGGGQPALLFSDESGEWSQWVGYRLVRRVEVPHWDAPMGLTGRLQDLADDPDYPDGDDCDDPAPSSRGRAAP